MSHREHEETARDALRNRPIRIGVITVSDTRSRENDHSGDAIINAVTAAGHDVTLRELVRDEPTDIARMIEQCRDRDDVDVILTTGGTGVALRDSTVDVVRPMLRYELDGFGELFRMLSYREIGAAAMLSRAIAGLLRTQHAPDAPDGAKFIFCMPGSRNAVRLAMTELIIPQLPHLVWQREM
ncbi:MAG: MogA/MoaB family molybdenum cofactor biosynthesis protein [Phycisphaerales bacterium]|nr:MogA/MoaB family molybdenum cofactor biosynthesis protein [Phycisphaerales bacterium]